MKDKQAYQCFKSIRNRLKPIIDTLEDPAKRDANFHRVTLTQDLRLADIAAKAGMSEIEGRYRSCSDRCPLVD